MLSSTDLVFLQEPQFDGDVGAQLVVLVLVNVKLALRLRDLVGGGEVARPRLQHLEVGAVRVVLDPARRPNRRNAKLTATAGFGEFEFTRYYFLLYT